MHIYVVLIIYIINSDNLFATYLSLINNFNEKPLFLILSLGQIDTGVIQYKVRQQIIIFIYFILNLPIINLFVK